MKKVIILVSALLIVILKSVYILLSWVFPEITLPLSAAVVVDISALGAVVTLLREYSIHQGVIRGWRKIFVHFILWSATFVAISKLALLIMGELNDEYKFVVLVASVALSITFFEIIQRRFAKTNMLECIDQVK